MPDVETLVPSAGTEVATAESPTEEVKPGQPSAAEQPQEAIPAEQPAQTVEETPEEELNLEEVPASSGDFPKYKPLFKEYPELRNILGREKAFTEIGTSFSDLKGIVERVPSLDDAETLATQAENHRLLGETFRTDPVGFVESLRENDPNAFANLSRQLPQILAETDTQVYAEQARFYTSAVLDNLFAMAQQSGDQEFLTAVQRVAQQGLGYQLGSSVRATPQPNSEVAKLRAQLEERNRMDAQSQVDSFWGELDSTFAGNLYTEIEASIKKAVPSASEAQLSRMTLEAVTKANQTLESQPQTVAQMRQFRAAAEKGRIGISDFKAALDYFTRRAKLVVPGVSKAVIEEWSNSVLKINNDKIAEKKGIAARTKDVGGAVQATSSTGTAPNGGGKKPSSREAIFRAIESGTYQPKS